MRLQINIPLPDMDKICLSLAVRLFGKHARYHVMNMVYLDGVLTYPTWVGPDRARRRSEVAWAGVPSNAMKPLNLSARIVHRAFKLVTRDSLKMKLPVDTGAVYRVSATSTFVAKPKLSGSVLYDHYRSRGALSEY